MNHSQHHYKYINPILYSQHGANINSLDKNGESALSKAVVGYPFRDELPGGDGHLAGEFWDVEPKQSMVAKLVENGADLLSKSIYVQAFKIANGNQCILLEKEMIKGTLEFHVT